MPTDSDRRIPSDDRYDRIACAACAWFLLGLFADGWSHYHDVRESFFTPYHAILYSGFLANILVIGIPWIRNMRAGYQWQRALPPGYLLSVAGIAIFTVGVAPDMLWHRIFGIEEGIDVLISPTHLFLGVGMALILCGPLRAALARVPAPATLEEQAPALISLALLLAMIEFALQFAYDSGIAASEAPVSASGPDAAQLAFYLLPFMYYKQAFGIAIIVIHAALFAGFALYAARNFPLKTGALTLLLGIAALLMSTLLSNGAVVAYVRVAEAVATGIAADSLLGWLKPSLERPLGFRVLAVLVPALQYSLMFLGAQLVLGGTWWDQNLALGSIVYAGVAGLLLSYLVVPTPARA